MYAYDGEMRFTYSYAETERGGIVRIATANPEALAAVHAFLKYQITEHATGDPLTVPGFPQLMN